jgi:hypothetical protein
MSTPVTPEMRQAVYADECARIGHAFDFTDMFHGQGGRGQLGNSDPGKLPVLTCMRCGRIWAILEADGASYQEAESKLVGIVKNPNDAKPKPRNPQSA